MRPIQDPLQDPQHDTADLLATLERIPRSELPDGNARRLLAIAIRAGEVDNLYKPMGCDFYNIAWANREPSVDPRQRVSRWVELLRGDA